MHQIDIDLTSTNYFSEKKGFVYDLHSFTSMTHFYNFLKDLAHFFILVSYFVQTVHKEATIF